MEANPDNWPEFAGVWDYDADADRLLDKISAACEEAGGSFPQRIEAALRATLELFAAEPELGLLLTARPAAGNELAIRRQQRWGERFGDLLRDAAARSPGARAHPPFVAPTLITGIRWRISSRLLADDGRGEGLEDLLPGLLEFVLACYLGPQDAVASLSEESS